MPRESKAKRLERAIQVATRLAEIYPEAACALNFSNAFTLLIAVLLSAQTTDAAVNRVTPVLFERWPNATQLAAADPDEVAQILRTIGFYRVKARHCIAASQIMVTDYGGQVPDSLTELQRLPGVGRKTANIVLHYAFGRVEGIAVDTHVYRIAHKLGFCPKTADTPDKVERDLLATFKRRFWGDVNRRWVLLGREFCIARRPRCQICPLADLCPSRLLSV